jgi:hypothetical protein
MNNRCKHDWDNDGKCCNCGIWKHEVGEDEDEWEFTPRGWGNP